jgi:hypothetical protein
MSFKILQHGRPPWALTFPLNSQDLGASCRQLGDEIYVGTLARQLKLQISITLHINNLRERYEMVNTIPQQYTPAMRRLETSPKYVVCRQPKVFRPTFFARKSDDSPVVAQGCPIERRDRSAAMWGTPDVLPT